MTHREKHNIESNCVSYNDDCYNETNSYPDNVKAMNKVHQKIKFGQGRKRSKQPKLGSRPDIVSSRQGNLEIILFPQAATALPFGINFLERPLSPLLLKVNFKLVHYQTVPSPIAVHQILQIFVFLQDPFHHLPFDPLQLRSRAVKVVAVSRQQHVSMPVFHLIQVPRTVLVFPINSQADGIRSFHLARIHPSHGLPALSNDQGRLCPSPPLHSFLKRAKKSRRRRLANRFRCFRDRGGGLRRRSRASKKS